MAVQVSGFWLNPPAIASSPLSRRRRNPSFTALSISPPPSSPAPTIQTVGGKNPSWYGNGDLHSSKAFEDLEEEYSWVNLESDLKHWTKNLRPVQWYPGHIAKTERELNEQLKLMDVVIEVRDARIPISTSHPQMDSWLGNRKRVLVLNREDMISAADRNAWADYYSRQGVKVVFSNGQLGMGTMKLGRLAKTLATGVNVKRRAKGLLPRPVRAGIVGYPNVGKSSLINRLLKRRICAAAPRPGVTRELKWVRFGKDLELLDSPGVIPMRISDQSAAIKLAICDDIGERSYDVTDVAAILVQMLSKLPAADFFARWRFNCSMEMSIKQPSECSQISGKENLVGLPSRDLPLKSGQICGARVGVSSGCLQEQITKKASTILKPRCSSKMGGIGAEGFLNFVKRR